MCHGQKKKIPLGSKCSVLSILLCLTIRLRKRLRTWIFPDGPRYSSIFLPARVKNAAQRRKNNEIIGQYAKVHIKGRSIMFFEIRKVGKPERGRADSFATLWWVRERRL